MHTAINRLNPTVVRILPVTGSFYIGDDKKYYLSEIACGDFASKTTWRKIYADQNDQPVTTRKTYPAAWSGPINTLRTEFQVVCNGRLPVIHKDDYMLASLLDLQVHIIEDTEYLQPPFQNTADLANINNCDFHSLDRSECALVKLVEITRCLKIMNVYRPTVHTFSDLIKNFRQVPLMNCPDINLLADTKGKSPTLNSVERQLKSANEGILVLTIKMNKMQDSIDALKKSMKSKATPKGISILKKHHPAKQIHIYTCHSPSPPSLPSLPETVANYKIPTETVITAVGKPKVRPPRTQTATQPTTKVSNPHDDSHNKQKVNPNELQRQTTYSYDEYLPPTQISTTVTPQQIQTHYPNIYYTQTQENNPEPQQNLPPMTYPYSNYDYTQQNVTPDQQQNSHYNYTPTMNIPQIPQLPSYYGEYPPSTQASTNNNQDPTMNIPQIPQLPSNYGEYPPSTPANTTNNQDPTTPNQLELFNPSTWDY